MEYNRHEYQTTGSRIGQPFELCHNPEISGEIVGQDGENWLIRVTVPYGRDSKVHVVIHEQTIVHHETMLNDLLDLNSVDWSKFTIDTKVDSRPKYREEQRL